MVTFVLAVVLHLKSASHSFLFSFSEMFLKLGTSALKAAFPENQMSESHSIGMGVAVLLRMMRARWVFSDTMYDGGCLSKECPVVMMILPFCSDNTNKMFL